MDWYDNWLLLLAIEWKVLGKHRGENSTDVGTESEGTAEGKAG